MTTIADAGQFRVLNGVHLKKMATAAALADATGVPPDQTSAVLQAAVKEGLVLDFDGKFLLAPRGTAAVQEYYAEVYRHLRTDHAVVAWYERFENLNRQFIRQVTDWQTSEGDQRARERILKSAERLVRSIQDLIPLLPRYQDYARRFAASIALVDQGKSEFICNPTVDSVHNIWFEFHEDVLTVLGRPRDV